MTYGAISDRHSRHLVWIPLRFVVGNKKDPLCGDSGPTLKRNSDERETSLKYFTGLVSVSIVMCRHFISD